MTISQKLFSSRQVQHVNIQQHTCMVDIADKVFIQQILDTGVSLSMGNAHTKPIASLLWEGGSIYMLWTTTSFTAIKDASVECAVF